MKTKKVKSPFNMTMIDFKKTDWVGTIAMGVAWIIVLYWSFGVLFELVMNLIA